MCCVRVTGDARQIDVVRRRGASSCAVVVVVVDVLSSSNCRHKSAAAAELCRQDQVDDCERHTRVRYRPLLASRFPAAVWRLQRHLLVYLSQHQLRIYERG